jgi:hypothetical protein
VGIGEKLNTTLLLKTDSSPFAAISLAAYAYKLGTSDFDFADDMAAVSKEGGNANPGPGVFPPDGTGGFIKFEESNTLLNIYDAGNFMTGKAFGMAGFTLGEIKAGAHINSFLARDGSDTKADQRAIESGYKYTGVVWDIK